MQQWKGLICILYFAGASQLLDFLLKIISHRALSLVRILPEGFMRFCARRYWLLVNGILIQCGRFTSVSALFSLILFFLLNLDREKSVEKCLLAQFVASHSLA
jgi:hypothetical protein